MAPRLHITDSEHIEAIHEGSLRVLERTGMLVDHDAALSMLADAGCSVDWRHKRVHFPPNLVMEQVGRVPHEIVLGGRRPSHDLKLGLGAVRPLTRPALGLEQTLDFRSGKVRPTTVQDLREWMTVTDALPFIDYQGVLSAVDLPLPSRDVSSAAIAAQYTNKHVHALAYSGPSVDFLSRLAQVVAGNAAEARRRPMFSFFQVCISPLYLSRRGVECILAAGRNSIPLFLNSSPIMGATGPVSISGCVTMLNAEILGMNVVHQLAHPGSAMVYTIRPSAMDMHTMASCWGMVEVSLAAALAVQLAKEKYGFIVDTYGPSTESKLLDVQLAMERTWTAFLPTLAGADIVCGAGNLESQSTMSLPQLLLDNELFATVKRMTEGVVVSPEDIGVDVIDQAGPKGQFLDKEHTLSRCRKAFLRTDLFDRNSRGAWEGKGRPQVADKVAHQLEDILQEHRVDPLSAVQLMEFEDIVSEARATITTFES
jgi:trimethylamine--corrinoid protein Co-methyltransferase